MADETDDVYVAATRVLWAPYVDKFPPEQHEYFVQSYAANADYRALMDFARRFGRQEAAAAIQAHADEHARLSRMMRIHLDTAARVAVGPPSREAVVAALEAMVSSPFAVGCVLDDAGRAVKHGNGLVTYPERKSTAPPPPSTSK